ncbi:ninein homolog [Onthophagus taurus]|uniref:ninein homolog n=1 Tax=Onthophagus taurus TaxID=166361 RepID=UPI0039BDE2C9
MMMEHRSLDPYEQQLLKVFDSYDYDQKGSLDRDGLVQLCQTLQLEERGTELIKCLLNEAKRRATFVEFKDALLALLGNIQNSSENINQVDGSPEREVSPKFVYGSKKYGRRSRPRSDEIVSPIKERNDSKCNINNNVNSVQRSNSQSDVLYTKKRKTSVNLKRCTSFPGSNLIDNEYNDETFINNHLICTESMLREAWKKLGVGEDGYLNQTELILVCNAIGLNELANGVLRQISDRLINDFDHRISFEELLEILQRDEAWSDVLNSTPKSDLNISCPSNDSIFLNSKSVQYITLGPRGNGYINIDTLIELWEMAGITSPKLLINDLGFTSNDIDIVELASVLEKEIKGIQETSRSDFSNPHIALLQAVLALYQSEIKCLKNILEQMQAEREKLKSDVSEANNRASLLAQEVDDNHAKMEKSTLKQVRHLEQRHSEILKDLTEQFSNEKDQMSSLNKNLEERIKNLETEEYRLRSDLNVAHKYHSSIEKENQTLSNQVTELEQARDTLNEQVRSLEYEKQQSHDSEQLHIQSLVAKLSELQLENVRLRDRNDEMQSEIESLVRSKTVVNASFSDTSIDNVPVLLCEGVGGGHGAKRRSDESPSKDLNVLGLGDTSPRLGKVRKFQKNKDILELPFTSSESGFETELDCLDSSLSNTSNETDDLVMRLQAKVDALEQVLLENSIPLPSHFASESESDSALLKVKKLTGNSDDIERLLIDLKDDIQRLYLKNTANEDVKRINDNFERLVSTGLNVGPVTSSVSTPEIITHFEAFKKQTNDASTETEPNNKRNFQPNEIDPQHDQLLNERLKKIEEENEALKSKCEELQQCLQQLENEYVNCEKYWENTLEEERKVFEQEQIQYSEHLNQLTGKIAEYEEEFVEKKNRLPPIEEKRNLEEQFTDLEQEFEDYKDSAEFQLDEKDREIADLKEKLEEVVKNEKELTSISIQTEIEPKSYNLSNHVVECTNLFSSNTMPYPLSVQDKSTQLSEDSIPINLIPPNNSSTSVWNQQENSEPMMIHHNLDTTTSLPATVSFQTQTNFSEENVEVKQSLSMYDLPSTSTEPARSSSSQRIAAPLRPKRMRKHDKASQRLYSKKTQDVPHQHHQNENENGAKYCVNDRVVVPLDTLHNMNARIHHLEIRCRQLQMFIKQQHFHADQVLQHSWQTHREEKLQLQFALKTTQEKLERQFRICNEQLERLAKNDMLVKDIYVENAFLVANVQRLEQKCNLLSQCNATNSV